MGFSTSPGTWPGLGVSSVGGHPVLLLLGLQVPK